MAKQFIKYTDAWKDEIISHFGSVSSCARFCGIIRTNLQKSISGKDGYISERMLLIVCRNMNLAPLCFTDQLNHNTFYNDNYKMSFDEYRQLSISKQLRTDSMRNKTYTSADAVSKITAGLTDREIELLPSTARSKISLMISQIIDAELEAFIPDWKPGTH